MCEKSITSQQLQRQSKADYHCSKNKDNVQTYLENIRKKHWTREGQLHSQDSGLVIGISVFVFLLYLCQCNDIACDNPMDVSCAYIILIG